MSRLVAAAALAASLAVSAPALAASRTYDLAPFDEVSVSTGITAVVSIADTQTVAAEADTDATLNRLTVRVERGRLELAIDKNIIDLLFTLGQRDNVVVRVTAPAISLVEASSGANVDAKGMAGDALTFGSSSGASLAASGIAGKGVTLDASSGARLSVSGTCDSLVANASAGASLDAVGLACKSVEANASAGAQISVMAEQSLKADASSGAGISVHGKPPQSSANGSSGGSITFVP